MKRKIILIICIVILIVLIILFASFISFQYETYIGVVTSIDNAQFIITTPDLCKYSIYTDNLIVTDSQGKKIDVSHLKIGDTVSIITKKGNTIDFVPTPLFNVKSVKFLGNNLYTLSQTLSLISLNSSEELILSDLDWLFISYLFESADFDSTYTKKELSKGNEYHYTPNGYSSYQYINKKNFNNQHILMQIIEIHENEIHLIINSNNLIQRDIKITDERCDKLKNVLQKYENNK